jgi:hypothetical protein
MTTLQEAENFWFQVCFDRRFQLQGRYQVYRELITSRMFDVLKNICPVTFEILGEENFWELLWGYLREDPPSSEILRELPRQVAEYLKEFPNPLLENHPYLAELIEYEFLEVRMMFFPEDEEKTQKGKVRINPAHALETYRWPVHFLSREYCQKKNIPAGTYHLLLWRDPRDLKVQFMEVNVLVASMVRLLEKGQKAVPALFKAIAMENNFDLSEEFLREGRILLDDLSRKGVLV